MNMIFNNIFLQTKSNIQSMKQSEENQSQPIQNKWSWENSAIEIE